jgi:DNA-binding transcriptional LysR family regulator
MTHEYSDAGLVAELVPHAALLTVLRETGTVTAAAATLGIPQPTASRRLAVLADRLGAALTIPEGRRIRLTRAGELLADAARTAIAALDDGIRQVREEVNPERGHVVLGFLHLLGRSLVPALLREFRARYPGTRFSLVQGSRQAIIEDLASGAIDLALVAPPPADPAISSATLSEQELVLSVPVGHRLAAREAVAAGELRDEGFVMLEHGYGLRQITDELGARAGFRPTVTFEGQESDTVRGLVAAGLGVALLPAFEPGSPPGVVELPIRPRARRSIALAWPESGPLPPAVATFRDFVRSRADRPEQGPPQR